MVKRICVIAVLSAMWVGAANATLITDNADGSLHLNELWNGLFEPGWTGSSQELFDTYGVPDGEDFFWDETNGGVHIHARYSIFGQNFGFADSSGYHGILTDINPGLTFAAFSGVINPNEPIVFFEYFTLPQDSNVGSAWFSANTINADLGDHFVAMHVNRFDESLVANYESAAGVDMHDNVYLFGFDVASEGDRDYNDLVVVVDAVRPHQDVVPEPATMLMLTAGLGAGLFWKRKSGRKI